MATNLDIVLEALDIKADPARIAEKPRREALFIETILPLSPSAWMKLAVREGWWHRA